MSSGSFSTIDLTLSSPNICNNLVWSVHNDLCDSDHFPILVSSNKLEDKNRSQQRRRLWKIDKADWSKFSSYFKIEYKTIWKILITTQT